MKIINLQELQSDFNSEIENSINQKFDIGREIGEIHDYIKNIPNFSIAKKPLKPLFNNNTRIFKVNIPDLLRNQFSNAFNSFIRIGSYELKRFPADTNEMYQIKENVVKQAYEFSEYYKWLDILHSTPQKAEKKDSLSHKQIIIALHYLGFDMKQFNQVKTGLILGEILGLDSKNTTDYIRHASFGKNNVRTSENLGKVKQLFEKHGLNEVSDKINPEKPRE